MYTTSTFHLASTFDLPPLFALPRAFFWIALAAWSATFVGLAKSTTRMLAVASR